MGAIFSRPPTDPLPRVRDLLQSHTDALEALSHLADGLTRRFEASALMLGDGGAGLLAAAAREGVAEGRAMSLLLFKALEAAREEEKVRGEQLEAYAVMIEAEVAHGELGLEGRVTPALLLCEGNGDGRMRVAQGACYVAVSGDGALGECVLACSRMRDGSVVCEFGGVGMTYYWPGEGEAARRYNVVELCVRDEVGECVESVEEDDVCVEVTGVAGVRVEELVLKEPGRVDVVYNVPLEGVILMRASVFGHPQPPFAIKASEVLLKDSAILSSLDRTEPETQSQFQGAMQEWLPGCTSTLLYRGTRDGLTPAAFHSHCDGKGATVTLIQSSSGAIFGGYSSVSWVCQEAGKRYGQWMASPGAFLFSVRGPHTVTGVPVKFPLKDEATKQAVCSWSLRGPMFGMYDVMVQTSGSPTGSFNNQSFTELGKDYVDTLGRGPLAITGTRKFQPVEMEVFAVKSV